MAIECVSKYSAASLSERNFGKAPSPKITFSSSSSPISGETAAVHCRPSRVPLSPGSGLLAIVGRLRRPNGRRNSRLTKRLPDKSRQVVPATESRLKCLASSGCGWSDTSPAPPTEHGLRSASPTSPLLQVSEQRKGETCWKLTALKAVGLDLAMETKAM